MSEQEFITINEMCAMLSRPKASMVRNLQKVGLQHHHTGANNLKFYDRAEFIEKIDMFICNQDRVSEIAPNVYYHEHLNCYFTIYQKRRRHFDSLEKLKNFVNKKMDEIEPPKRTPTSFCAKKYQPESIDNSDLYDGVVSDYSANHFVGNLSVFGAR